MINAHASTVKVLCVPIYRFNLVLVTKCFGERNAASAMAKYFEGSAG